jgi:hypothetical protein
MDLDTDTNIVRARAFHQGDTYRAFGHTKDRTLVFVPGCSGKITINNDGDGVLTVAHRAWALQIPANTEKDVALGGKIAESDAPEPVQETPAPGKGVMTPVLAEVAQAKLEAIRRPHIR